LSEIIDYAEGIHDRVDILHVIDSVGDCRGPKIISGAHLGHGGLFVVVGNAPLGDLLPKVDDEKIRDKSSPNWVSEILPVPGLGQMFRRKWSHFGVLQKLVHSRRCLHKREELEVTQTDVDAAEFAYLVRRVANKADWFSSKIIMDLGCVEVLESTPRGNRPNGCNGTSRNASDEVLEILVVVILHAESLFG